MAAELADATPDTGLRIGLFGGSFDPVHRTHVELARVAVAQLGLDELRWIPAGQPWQKSRHLTDARHREAMVRLAMDGVPGPAGDGGNRFILDRSELRRRGPSFTLDTVRELQAAHRAPAGRGPTRWFLVLGQDQYAGLHTWRDWRELLDRVTPAVARRPDAAREAVAEVAAFPHRTLELPMSEVSSSDVRERLAAGRPIDDLVPLPVARYIEQHGLYR